MIKKLLSVITRRKTHGAVKHAHNSELNKYVDMLVHDYGETLKSLSKE